MTNRKKTLIAAAALLVLMIGGYLGAAAYRKAQAAKPVTFEPRESIKFTSPERDKIIKIAAPSAGIVLEKQEDLWELAPPQGIRLDQAAIENTLWSLGYLSADRIIDEAPEDLSLYGLDNPRAHIIITGSGGETAEFFGGNRAPSGSGYYVMTAGDPKVYLVSSYSGEKLYLTMKDIRDKSLSSEFEIEKVRRFLLEKGGSRLEIVPAAEAQAGMISELFPYVLIAPYAVPREADSEAFAKLLESFLNIQIVDFIDDAPSSLEPYGLDEPARLVIETEDQTLDLLLGKTVNDHQYAKVPEEKGVFTVNALDSVLPASPFGLAAKFALLVNIEKVDSFTVRGKDRPVLDAEIKRAGEGDDKTETYFLNGRQAAEKSFKAFYQTVIGLLADAEHPNRPGPGGDAEITIEYNLNNPAGKKALVKLVPYNRDFYALDREGAVEFLISRPQVNAIYQAVENMSYDIE
ncbi:MAG: DUF4340 domain-containing protein [Treponema sp.]|jgi:hypothetical protein|nr:DUF4340 domain-containing protein [Treponema sp.]